MINLYSYTLNLVCLVYFRFNFSKFLFRNFHLSLQITIPFNRNSELLLYTLHFFYCFVLLLLDPNNPIFKAIYYLLVIYFLLCFLELLLDIGSLADVDLVSNGEILCCSFSDGGIARKGAFHEIGLIFYFTRPFYCLYNTVLEVIDFEGGWGWVVGIWIDFLFVTLSYFMFGRV